ncbi:MAG: HigA family addiction module antitoxin, partial [Polyangia bacterium]
RDELLAELGIPETERAAKLGIPVPRIKEVANGKRGITPATAWLFAGAFVTTPEFWMNLQTVHDLSRNRPDRTAARLRGGRPQAHASWPSCRATDVLPQHDGR